MDRRYWWYMHMHEGMPLWKAVLQLWLQLFHRGLAQEKSKEYRGDALSRVPVAYVNVDVSVRVGRSAPARASAADSVAKYYSM